LEIVVKNPSSTNPLFKTPSKSDRNQKAEKESTESFEDLGKGMVLIVSPEEEIKPQHSNARAFSEAATKEQHSNRNSRDLSNVQTRDMDNSGFLNSELEQKPQCDPCFSRRKISLSFTAPFGSENCSSKELNPGDASHKNTVSSIFRFLAFMIKIFNSSLHMSSYARLE
jgi:hypothetical protein